MQKVRTVTTKQVWRVRTIHEIRWLKRGLRTSWKGHRVDRNASELQRIGTKMELNVDLVVGPAAFVPLVMSRGSRKELNPSERRGSTRMVSMEQRGEGHCMPFARTTKDVENAPKVNGGLSCHVF